MAKKENSFSGWLQRVRKTGEFSDVIVLVEGQEFHLHMLPLLNASLYFRSLPSSSSPYRTDNERVIEIRDMPGGAEGFSVAADFSYLIKPTYTLENVAKIRAVAEHLGMAELQDSTKKFLYTNIFSHWRSCIAFLQQYKRLDSSVDDYIESRCLKVISAACIKAFFDTKYLSAPIPLGGSGSSNTWQSSPCQILTDTLVRVASLPDEYVQEVVEELVNGEVNLNLKCRQGRNVKGWLDSTIMIECRTDRAKCWVVVCLIRMLEKSVTMDRPWLELSSQYWCGLLEHLEALMKIADLHMLERLQPAKVFLEERIGGSLHELDDYLLTYSFEPQTLLDLVKHFKQTKEVGEQEMGEVASEVDSCLWSFVDTACISAEDFISFIEAFPKDSRTSHDMLYTAIEKLIAKADFENEEKQRLWGLVEITKLSISHKEKALNNAIFLCQPQVLEYVLRQHSEELAEMGDEDRHKLKEIMQKVIRASLKLLEENSRRSKEIMELQKQYASLIGSKACYLQDSCESSPDIIFNKSRMNGCVHSIIPDEVEEVQSDTPTRRSTCSSVEY
ncbi:hypothetical protein GOP47_0002263 [Adiantum capillus-veneris]|uniref:Uncharacterized protein n=1 Tax=Adiantum capillus-veneris TaxID=13818 RepID=A0A9D4VAM7_ADICA|nr:hypothetical protein GOP47_0002263 [Adiantum capillus-veneris]